VALLNLVSADIQQGSLFGPTKDNRRLMAVMDRINAQWGQGTVRSAATGVAKSWAMRRERMSPHYTTDWRQLVVVG
jgi:DNA polymerase V